MEKITAHVVAEKLTPYLPHDLSSSDLTNRAEQAMMDGEFTEDRYETIRDIVSRFSIGATTEEITRKQDGGNDGPAYFRRFHPMPVEPA